MPAEKIKCNGWSCTDLDEKCLQNLMHDSLCLQVVLRNSCRLMSAGVNMIYHDSVKEPELSS